MNRAKGVSYAVVTFVLTVLSVASPAERLNALWSRAGQYGLQNVAVCPTKRIYVSTAQYRFFVRDLDTGVILVNRGAPAPSDAAFSPDGSRLAVTFNPDLNSDIFLFDTTTWDRVLAIPAAPYTADNVCWAVDGNSLFVSHQYTTGIGRFSAIDGTLLQDYSTGGDTVKKMAVSTDGTLLGVASGTTTLRVLSTSDGSTYRTLTCIAPATAVAFGSALNKIYIGLNTGDLEEWDLQLGVRLRVLHTGLGSITDLSVAINAGLAAVAGSSNDSMIADLSSMSVSRLLQGHGQPVRDVAITEDGATSLSTSVADPQPFNRLNVWDVASGNLIRQDDEAGGSANALVVSQDGAVELEVRTVGEFGQGNTNTLTLRKTSDGSLIRQTVDVYGTYGSACCSPDNALYSVVTHSGSLSSTRSYRITDGAFVRSFPIANSSEVRITYSPSGKQIAAFISSTKTLTLFDSTSGIVQGTLQLANASGSGLSYDPSGRYIALGSQQGVIVCDSSATRIVATLPVSLPTGSLAFSNNGLFLAARGRDAAYLFRTSDWGLQAQFAVAGTSSVGFSGDGQYLWVFEDFIPFRVMAFSTTDMSQVLSATWPGTGALLNVTPDDSLLILNAATEATEAIPNPLALSVAIVRPLSLHVVTGKPSTSDPGTLANNDGYVFRDCQYLTVNQLQPPVMVEVEGVSPMSSPSGLKLISTVRAVNPGLFGQKLELFDWTANAYSSVDVRSDPLSTAFATFTLQATGDLSRYVSSTRRLKARFSVRTQGPSALSLWCTETDRFVWSVSR